MAAVVAVALVAVVIFVVAGSGQAANATWPVGDKGPNPVPRQQSEASATWSVG